MRSRNGLGLLLALLGACGTGREGLPAPEDLAGLLRPAPAPAWALAPATPPAGGKLTLEETRRRIWNLEPPLLQAARERYREALGRITQGDLLPNPVLTFREEMLDGSGGPLGGLSKLELSQTLELGGKRTARTAEARALARLTLDRFQGLVQRTELDAELALWRVVRRREEAELAAEERRLAAELAGLAAERHRQGKIALPELRKFEVAAEQARLQAWSEGREEEKAGRRLAEILGLSPESPTEVAASWPEAGELPGEESLAGALARHPRRAGAAAAVHAAELGLDREAADAWPDLTVMAMGMHDRPMRDSYLGFGLSLPLPLFHRNQGRREEAEAAIQRARREQAAEELALQRELAEAIISYTQAARLLADFDREILPRVEETARLSAEAFAAGRATQLEVLDSLLLLTRTRRTRLAWQEDLARAQAELRYLTGLEPRRP